MKPCKKIFRQILVFAKTLLFGLYQPKYKSILMKDVPYFAQWESPELVKDILSKKIDARQDPKWKKSGAKNKLEYLHWSWSACGLTCLKMIIKKQTKKTIPLIELAKKSLENNIYTKNKKAYEQADYINSFSSLKYLPFVKFINKNFSLHAKIINPLVKKEIIYYLDQSNFVIASVNAKIRNPNSRPAQKGGHLILILGYNVKKQIFIFHNPSGTSIKNQKYAKINFSQFKYFFDNKGIAIKSYENNL